MRGLDKVGRAQVPYASALTINTLATGVKDDTPRQMEKDLDRPTPYTKRGIFITRASKRKLSAVVGFKDRQAGYLRLQAKGGVRLPKGRAIPVPVKQRRNKYGNMPRGALRRAIANNDRVFSGRVRGVSGVWKRLGPKGRKSLNLLAVYADQANYQKAMRWSEDEVELIRRRLPHAARQAFARAFATAR
jgi:hypothetical protein